MLNIVGVGVGDFELSWLYVLEKIFLEQGNYYFFIKYFILM